MYLNHATPEIITLISKLSRYCNDWLLGAWDNIYIYIYIYIYIERERERERLIDIDMYIYV